MRKNWYLLLLILASFQWSCDTKKLTENEANLPLASSVANELLVVMDSTQWESELGEKIREIYGSDIPGLPQPESAFEVRYTSPRHFKGFMKHYPNIVFVTTIQDNSRDSRLLRTYFTENSLNQMKKNPDMFMFPLENEYARGQKVLHLFGQTEEELLEKLNNNENRLFNYFHEFERNRLSKRLFTGRPNKKISQYVQRKHGFWMEFPVGYEVAIEKENFIWIRLLDPEVDKNIWVGYKEYENEDVFEKENILKLRQEFAQPSIWGNDSTTYLKTEPDAPVHMERINFNGSFAVETRGLWRLNNMVMGGPFLSYTFVDEATNRLYYIEGFTYAPGKNKRNPIRELEAILWTFKAGEAKAPANNASARENQEPAGTGTTN